MLPKIHAAALASCLALVQSTPSAWAGPLAPLEPSKVVARIDGTDISQGQVDAVAGMMAGARPVDDRTRQSALRQMVQVLSVGATPDGVKAGAEPKTVFLQSFMGKVALAEAAVAQMREDAKADPAAVKAAYDKYAAGLKARHWVDVVQVVVPQKDAAKSEALAKALGDDHGADRAAALSKQANALGLRPFDNRQTALEDLAGPLRDKAMAAKPGEVVGPVATAFGTTFLVASPVEPRIEPFDKRRVAIEASLKGNEVARMVRGAVSAARVEVLDPSLQPPAPAHAAAVSPLVAQPVAGRMPLAGHEAPPATFQPQAK